MEDYIAQARGNPNGETAHGMRRRSLAYRLLRAARVSFTVTIFVSMMRTPDTLCTMRVISSRAGTPCGQITMTCHEEGAAGATRPTGIRVPADLLKLAR